VNKEKLNKLSESELREHLRHIPLNKFPKGNSRFKCDKHNIILSYCDIVSGCYSCIMDEANHHHSQHSCINININYEISY